MEKSNLAFIYHSPFFYQNDHFWSAHPAIGKYVDSLADYFAKIEIIAPRPGPGDQPRYCLKSSNLSIKQMPAYSNILQFWLKAPAYIKQLEKAASSWDIVHIRMPTHSGFLAYRAALRHHKPVFLTVVGEGMASASLAHYSFPKQALTNIDGLLQDILMKWMIQRSLTFANGEALLSKYKGGNGQVYLTRSSTVGKEDIISTNHDTCLEKTIRILTVATIAPHKGVSLIPQIIAQLKIANINAAWSYVGGIEGNAGKKELQRTRALADQLGIADALKFYGLLDWEDLQKHYRSNDIFVLPTYVEGIPRVILEAQAAGLPVITTKVGGIPQAVKDGYDAILVPAGEPKAFSGAIERTYKDKEFRQFLIRNGIEAAKEHSLETETRRMLQIAGNLLHFDIDGRSSQ